MIAPLITTASQSGPEICSSPAPRRASGMELLTVEVTTEASLLTEECRTAHDGGGCHCHHTPAGSARSCDHTATSQAGSGVMQFRLLRWVCNQKSKEESKPRRVTAPFPRYSYRALEQGLQTLAAPVSCWVSSRSGNSCAEPLSGLNVCKYVERVP